MKVDGQVMGEADLAAVGLEVVDQEEGC